MIAEAHQIQINRTVGTSNHALGVLACGHEDHEGERGGDAKSEEEGEG